MKKSKYLDIVILLGFLLLLSAGASLLAQTAVASNLQLNNDKTILEQMSPLFMGRNSKKIAQFISEQPQPQQLRLIHTILEDQKNPLEVTDKIKLILELARKTDNQNHRVALYNALIQNEQVAHQKPLLFVAAENNYEDLMGSIADWLSHHTKVFNDWFYKGVSHAIKENKPDVASKLLSRFLTLPTDQATKLLWEVIRGKKSPDFIAPLVKKGASVADVMQGRTPLIVAVELQEYPLVAALLENGAQTQINNVYDPAVGTALQVAQRTKATTIELLLRKYGADENAKK